MNLSRNNKLLTLSNLLAGMVFFYAVEKLFYRSVGIDDFEIGITIMAFLGVVTLADVPTGVLADRWSRKGSLMLAIGALGLSSIIMGTAQDLTQIIIGVAVWAFYFVLTSGSYQALTYDLLHEENNTEDYSRVVGLQKALFMMGIVISSIAGGFVGEQFGLRSTYWLTLVPVGLNLIILALIAEPTFHKSEIAEKLSKHMKTSLRLLVRDRTLFRHALLFIVISIVATHLYEYIQIYAFEFTTSTTTVGLLNALFALSGAIGQYTAHRYKEKQLFYIVYALAILIGLSGLIQAPFAFLFFVGALMFAEVGDNRIETIIQNETPSAIRATTLSVLSMIYGLVAGPFILLFGYISRESSIFNALLVLTVFIVVYALTEKIVLQKKR